MKPTNFKFLATVVLTFTSFLAEVQYSPLGDDDVLLAAPIKTK